MPAAADGNLFRHLEAAITKAGEKPVFLVPGATAVSYRRLAAEISKYANALTACGVKPGDRVAVQVEKSVANVCLYLACLKAGAVFNPLNTAYTAAELEYFIEDAEPALVVVSSATAVKLCASKIKESLVRLETLEADGSGSLADLAAAQSPSFSTVPRDAKDMAALLYTSGTTGRSKGAMITHENLTTNALTLSSYWGFRDDDVLLHALPIFHVHGLFVALHTALLNGCTMHWLAKFELDEVMHLLPKSTAIMGVPTFYTRLLGVSQFGKDHCARLRLAISGSAPLLAETHVEFEKRTGLQILERYGMTEAGMITSNPYHDGSRVAGTVGYALPGIDVRVATPEGKILPKGEVGVLEVKGPNVFAGYWRNPEKTREDFRPDGYFITGDLAQIAMDGRVSIVGRAKDLIISGGFNVYPKEIETEINALPGIAESAVVGIPHPDFGEGVIAVVTMAAGSKALTEAEVIGPLKERLAKFKLPKRVFVVADLPRNAMGKVQKAELRKTYGVLFKS
jgi:malonyl-CoA/methylmalonyl-CoA synthetase